MTMQAIKPADFAKAPALKEHSARSRAVARALDEKAADLPHAMTFTCLGFGEFLNQLTPKRFQLLRLASKGKHSITDLATASHRDPSAVSRDIAKLIALGLVRVECVPNSGHGRKKIVLPVATTIAITASIVEA